MARVAFNEQVTTGTLNTVSNASVTGASVLMIGGDGTVRAENLSAYLTITAATTSMTCKPHWQVSNDNSTWKALNPSPNTAAELAVVTGVANVTIAVSPPRAVNGYRWARCLLLVGGATGLTDDLFSIGYSFIQRN